MSDNNVGYDPNAPEGESSAGNQYLSWKDIRILIIVVVLLIICLLPIYNMGVKNSEKARCTQNMKAIYEAMGLYTKDHDDGLPPLYRANDQFVPSLGPDTGRAYTWASDIQGYMGPRANFVCPSAKPEEVVQVEDPKSDKQTVPMSYGMYAPYGGMKLYNIESPEQTILIAETSNEGAQTSYDPVRFTDGDKRIPDGFVIGWDDSNFEGSSESKFVTRLAFRNTSNGSFTDQAESRHDAGLHALTASGQRIILKPKDAIIKQRDKLPGGMWAVPPARRSKPKTP